MYIYKCMSMVQKEFEDMAADLRRRIVTLARGFRLDSDSAEDVAQDTMLKLWTIREKIDGKPSAAAMATTIARHLSISRCVLMIPPTLSIAMSTDWNGRNAGRTSKARCISFTV